MRNPFKELSSVNDLLNPFGKLQRAFEMADPLRQHREAMRLADPLNQYSEAMKLADPLKQYRGALELTGLTKSYDLTGQNLESFKTYKTLIGELDSLGQYQRLSSVLGRMEAESLTGQLHNSFNQDQTLAGRLASAANLKGVMSSYIANTLDRYNNFEVDKVSEQLRAVQELMHSESLGMLCEKAEDFSKDIGVSRDGSLTVDGEALVLSELNDVFQKVIEKSDQTENEAFVNEISRLIEVVEGLKETRFEKVVFFLMCSIFITIVQAFIFPIVENKIETNRGENKRSLGKEIKKSVRNSIGDAEVLSRYRYVSATSLNIRGEASMKSEILSVINLGTPVLVVKKDRKWTLVEWRSIDGDSVVRGWVSSRYLKKFR